MSTRGGKTGQPGPFWPGPYMARQKWARPGRTRQLETGQ